MAAEKKPEKQIDAYMESMKAYQKTYEFLLYIYPILAQFPKFEKFALQTQIKLQINPKSTILYAGNGIDFCGYIHHPEYKKVRKASVRKLKKNVKQLEAGELERVEFEKKYQSRLGHMGHADTYHLTKAIEYELLFWEWEQTESGIAIPA